ncbi:MAG TPA: CpsD/CapB family tyrosine-protein kinase [Caldilineae bacterium]|nr:CpsD/CapB family tyrosine-protein kinase [Caldilineae bacterium]
MALDLITVTDPRSPVAEAYRSLRTNLEFSSLDHPLHTLLVTSPGPDEGKSTTLANLAVTTAQTGRRVIVVDCDLRRPRQHEIFGVSNGTGLTTMVRDEAALTRPPLQKTQVAGLWVLPSGPLPPNPAELLASQRMSQVIERLMQSADLVLFDAPPVIAVTDAAVLASKLDGVLLVINAGSTKRQYALRAKEILERVNARLIGAVLNNVVLDKTLHTYYT